MRTLPAIAAAVLAGAGLAAAQQGDGSPREETSANHSDASRGEAD